MTPDQLLEQIARRAAEQIELQQPANYDETVPIIAAELAPLKPLIETVERFLAYRERVGALGFQVEKADDYFAQLRKALADLGVK